MYPTASNDSHVADRFKRKHKGTSVKDIHIIGWWVKLVKLPKCDRDTFEIVRTRVKELKILKKSWTPFMDVPFNYQNRS